MYRAGVGVLGATYLILVLPVLALKRTMLPMRGLPYFLHYLTTRQSSDRTGEVSLSVKQVQFSREVVQVLIVEGRQVTGKMLCRYDATDVLSGPQHRNLSYRQFSQDRFSE